MPLRPPVPGGLVGRRRGSQRRPCDPVSRASAQAQRNTSRPDARRPLPGRRGCRARRRRPPTRERGVRDPHVGVGHRDRVPPGAVGGDGGLGLEGVDRDVHAGFGEALLGHRADHAVLRGDAFAVQTPVQRSDARRGPRRTCVAATRTRKPSDVASAIPSGRAPTSRQPRCWSCSSGVAESRLTCRTTDGPGPQASRAAVRARRSSRWSQWCAPGRRRRRRSVPRSGCMNGSPPVRKSSRPPSRGELGEDLARPRRGRAVARPPWGRTRRSSTGRRGCSRSWCRPRDGDRPASARPG